LKGETEAMKYHQAIISGLNIAATDTTVADYSVSNSQNITYFSGLCND